MSNDLLEDKEDVKAEDANPAPTDEAAEDDVNNEPEDPSNDPDEHPDVDECVFEE